MKSRPVVMFALIGVVISVVWYMFMWSPKQTDLKDSRAAHSAAEDETAKLKTELSQLEDIDAQGPKIDAEVARLRTYVPKNPELASFLLTANDLAIQSGIDWLSITPGEPVADLAGGPTVISIALEVEGEFSEMLKYLDGVEKLSRLVIVDQLQLAAGGSASDDEGAPTDANGAPTLKASFSARMFTEAVPAGATVAAAPAAGETTPTTVASAGKDS